MPSNVAVTANDSERVRLECVIVFSVVYDEFREVTIGLKASGSMET